MDNPFRRLLGLAAVVAGCLGTIAPAAAQWGYPAPTTYGATYYGSTMYGATYAPVPAYQTYDANPYPSRYSFHGPGYGFGGYPAYVNAPYHLQPSPYGYPQPYGYGIHSRRGLIDWDDWSPFGEREIEYEYRRDGTVRIDIDD